MDYKVTQGLLATCWTQPQPQDGLELKAGVPSGTQAASVCPPGTTYHLLSATHQPHYAHPADQLYSSPLTWYLWLKSQALIPTTFQFHTPCLITSVFMFPLPVSKSLQNYLTDSVLCYHPEPHQNDQLKLQSSRIDTVCMLPLFVTHYFNFCICRNSGVKVFLKYSLLYSSNMCSF